MSALIPKVPAVLDEMAEWISDAFASHPRTPTIYQSCKSPADTDMLSFVSSRQKHASSTSSRTATPQEREYCQPSDTKLAAVALQQLHESASEPHIPKRPPLEVPKTGSEEGKKDRRGSSTHRPFDAAAILQRRREEAVFGLKEPISPTLDKHNSPGAKKAEEAIGYEA